MHPIHPIVVHFPIALLCASVAFDALASRWPTGGLRETSLYTLLAGVVTAALAVVTGGMEEELAERAGAPESVLELHESLGTVTLVVFGALLGLRLAMRWGWFNEIPSLTLGLGAIGIVILTLTGYWGGELVYTYGIGVKAVMSPVTP
ncbi:MAG: DUF2231 domain-containing protein [Nitrospirota bacterium]|nr:DUF2231 domain-containing protein [Nitrospirota bacterium]MDP2382035.1 DUF2231 domain-containing protein [Nitrospirota bacterium]